MPSPLLPKPTECDGCPLYQDGFGFVPDEVVEGATVYLVMQNPGENEAIGRRFTGYRGGETWEASHPAPAIGKSGHFQETRLFPLAGVARGKDLCIGNVIRCRWQKRNTLPPLSDPQVKKAILHCQSKYFRPPASTRLLIAEGEYALWGLTGEISRAEEDFSEKGRSLSSWRGWLLPYRPPRGPQTPPPNHQTIYTPTPDSLPVLVMYHTAFLFRAPQEKTVTQWDWIKAGEFLAGRWPVALPVIQRRPPDVWPATAAFDTEFIPKTNHLTRYSLAYRERMTGTPHVWVVERGYNLCTLPALPPVAPTLIMHNALADLKYLPAVIGTSDITIEDTMISHSLLWSDHRHALGYLGSLYARTNRWKHLVELNPVEYAAGDALGTWDVWVALAGELQRDPQTDLLYRQFLPLLPKIAESETHGIRTNQQRVQEVIQELSAAQHEASRMAQAWCGWPINVGSASQIGQWLYRGEGMDPRICARGRGRRPR